MSAISVVLSRPRSGIPEPAFRGMAEKIAAAVGEEIPFAVVSHLYDAAPQGPVFQFLRELPGDLLMLAPLYPRAAHLVLRANGVDVQLGGHPDREAAGDPAVGTPGSRIAWYLDYRDYLIVDELAEKVRAFLHSRRAATVHAASAGSLIGREWRIVEEEVRPRWYPVIDPDRCRQCYECVNFCLFGVFDLDTAGRIFVAQPEACRPGCPACARVCPEGAIVFPLYNDPIIAGADGNGKDGTPPGLISLSPPPPPRRAPPEADSTREQAQAERRRYLADAGLGGTNGKDGPSAGGPGGERT
ncbi:MAG: ferredoxin family protein, partial [Thermogutta sp.]|nr:ferredoxin family protein [Thermogutta sp.]